MDKSDLLRSFSIPFDSLNKRAHGMPVKTETPCCTPGILECCSSVISWRRPYAISWVAVAQSSKYGTIVHQKQRIEVFLMILRSCAACNLHSNCFSETIPWVLAAVTYLIVRRHVSVSENTHPGIGFVRELHFQRLSCNCIGFDLRLAAKFQGERSGMR